MISAICVSCRDEVAKAIRRALGDNGGVKFCHGTYNFRGGWSNAIDTVLKDNLLIEVYECEPTHGVTFQKTPKEKRKHILMHSWQYKKHDRESVATHKAKTGICDEGRSIITHDYARNFIADFILGKPSGTVPQQTDLFDALVAED